MTPLEKTQYLQAVVNGQAAPLRTAYSFQQFNKMVFLRWLRENTLVFLLQYVGLLFSTLGSQPSSVWFASGTACAFVFMRGISILPAVWLGSLVAYIIAKAPLALACTSATLFTLQAWLLLFLNYRLGNPTLIFNHQQPFLKFLSSTLIITAVTTLLLKAASAAVLLHCPSWLIAQWWLANLNGILLFSCAIVTWDAYFTQLNYIKKTYLQIISFNLIILLLLIGLFVLTSNVFVSFLLFSLILIISRYSKWCGSVAALFLTGLLFSLENNDLFSTFFLTISAITGLWIAATDD